jgi:orotidine-5'-phosphate decarboxylase
MKKNKIFFAVDTKNIEKAIKLSNQLKPYIAGIKIGLEFFLANGPEGIRRISKVKIPIFLDLKLFDITNTVCKAIESLDGLPINYLSIHVLNGKETLIKAKEKIKELSIPFKLLGVTVLTSFNGKTLKQLGIKNSMKEEVKVLSKIAKESGLDGIVCSSHEIKTTKSICKNMEIFTPGIRTNKIKNDDQKRIMTPKKAISLGSDYLVMGRSISLGDPIKNIKKILDTIK